MKNLKEILVLFGAVMALLVTNVGFAEEEAAAPPVEQSRVDSVFSGASTSAAETSIETTESLVSGAYGATTVEDLSGKVQEVKNSLKQLEGMMGSAATSDAATSSFLSSANSIMAGQCQKLSQNAIRCCSTPDSCGAGSGIKKAAPYIGLIGGLMSAFGGEGGAANCLASLPDIANGLGQSSGTSKACGMLRDGGYLKDVQVVGAVQLCSLLKDIVQQTPVKPSGEAQKQSIVSKISSFEKQVAASLSGGEEKAEEQQQGMQSSMAGINQCAESLMAGDDIAEAGEVAGIDCGNASDAAANPVACPGYGGLNNGTNGILGKTSGFDLATSSGAEDLPDDDVLPEAANGAPVDTPLGGAVAAKTTSAGGFGSGSGSGGAQQKAGKRRGAGKSKKLVAGYKASRGGSSGSSGSRSPSGFKGFKNKFKFKKKKDKTDKVALAALSKLVKAGISPDQSGSIFERVSNRFSVTTTKENLFDCKRNKKLWMEK
ncbi:MAG: hypothetical protein ACRBBP_07355 [Bdellovibrionales bacterium]